MFNLEDYEDVATLNRWLNEHYPMNRVEVECVKHDSDKGHILVKASVYRDSNDLFPAASNLAFGSRDLYNRNMARFYVEDTSTSAIGRAIIILKGSSKTATKESMMQVSESQAEIAKAKAKMAASSGEYIPVVREDDPWTVKSAPQAATMQEAVAMVKEIIGGQTEKDIPRCPHGEMYWKTGTAKSGKPWGHFKCMAAANGEITRCLKPDDVIWYEIAPSGEWRRQASK